MDFLASPRHERAGLPALRVRRLAVFLGILLLWVASVRTPASGAEVTAPGYAFDEDNGREIMELCAGCHGEFGQGGGGGEYPRLAGMPARYLAKALRDFKAGARENMAMAPYMTERELPETDLLDIANFISRMELYTRMPTADPDLDSYAKLMLARKVLNIPLYPGDPDNGQALYRRKCQRCHAPEGQGRGKNPRLAGQYSEYLLRQMEAFVAGTRDDRAMTQALKGLEENERADILAFLSSLDD